MAFTPLIMRYLFQSTRPIRGATSSSWVTGGSISLISIHAPHTGRDISRRNKQGVSSWISIHAPHTGRDVSELEERLCPCISIHAPHTGRDDGGAGQGAGGLQHFNPRAPYGARLQRDIAAADVVKISIHAPHTGRDGYSAETTLTVQLFQSTRPIRGAT